MTYFSIIFTLFVSSQVSFNTNDLKSPTNKQNRPSSGGWSPAQNIICATPKNINPTTPKDKINDSLEQCSLKKIQSSHQKLLSDLYGDTWKSIPSLFKTIKQNHEHIDGISKKLQFNDDDSDKENNIRSDLKRNKELYLTNSETKLLRNNSFEEKKSKKRLYTEKIPSTPDLPKQKPKVKSSVKKGKSVTDLVKELSSDVEILRNKVQNVCVTPKNDVNRLSFVASLAGMFSFYFIL